MILINAAQGSMLTLESQEISGFAEQLLKFKDAGVVCEYPSFFNEIYATQPKPDAIITRSIDGNLSIIQCLWDYKLNSVNDVTTKEFWSFPLPPSSPRRPKSASSEKKTKIRNPDLLSGLAKATSDMAISSNRRISTCIVCSGMSSFYFSSPFLSLYSCNLNHITSF